MSRKIKVTKIGLGLSLWICFGISVTDNIGWLQGVLCFLFGMFLPWIVNEKEGFKP
jgi:hypothetical protein